MRGFSNGKSPDEGELPLGLDVSCGASFSMPAGMDAGCAVSRTPCHDRRVRIEGDLAGRNVTVRCPTCSRLWEVRFPPARVSASFALWVA